MTDNDLVCPHAHISRRDPRLVDRPAEVLACYAAGGCGTEVMLLLRDGLGDHTERLDLADIDVYLTEHHPQVYTTRPDGGKHLNLETLPSDVLADCLKYARGKRGERQQPLAFEFGVLVDPSHSYLQYAQGGDWPTGGGAAVIIDGKLQIVGKKD